MPKPVDGKEEARQELATLEALEENVLDPGKPLMEHVKVVYLGSSRGESICLPGQILVSQTEDFEIDKATGKRRVLVDKSVSDDGHSSYDFSTHDAFGRLIEGPMLTMGDEYGNDVRGKRFAIVEHPAHIHAFFRRKGPDGRSPLFKVMLSNEQKLRMQDYIGRIEQKQGVTEKLFRATGGVVRGSDAP